MERKQFTFYESFYKALSRIRKEADRAKAYEAIVRFALYGEEPALNELPNNAAIAFELIRPTLEASQRKAKAGRKGGTSKSEANGKQTSSKTETKQEVLQEHEEANRKLERGGERERGRGRGRERMFIYSPPPNGVGEYKDPLPPVLKQERSKACDAFMSRINPTPSSGSMTELLEYERTLGTEVCLRAIDKALDANAPSWNYVRGILNRCKEQNITSLEEWDRQEGQRMNAKRRKVAQAEQEEAPVIDTGDLDFLIEQEEKAGRNWRDMLPGGSAG